VSQSLRKISEHALGLRVVFLRQKTNIVAQGKQALKQRFAF
jgi:hypothetical protein